MSKRFFIRWLNSNGLDEKAASHAADLARSRVRRYPVPIPFLFPFVLFFVDFFFPLLMQGRFCRVSSLSNDALNVFETKIQNHRCHFLRLLYLLVRMPLWEHVYGEEKPRSEFEHPLKPLIHIPSPGLQPPSPRGGEGWGEGGRQFDFLIVGSGAGGAPLAWSLSQKGFNVAVVESGNLVEADTSAHIIEHSYFKQGFTVSTKGGSIAVLAGDALGGTTAINSGTCLRPTQDALQEWDAVAGTEFSTGILDPYFKIVEDRLGVSVPPKSLLGPSSARFEEGLERLGYSGAYVLPRCAPNCKGSGRCCFGCPTGAKRSNDISFLPEAIQNGCEIFSGTTVQKIWEDEQGVHVRADGQGRNVNLNARTLILSAGALGTARLIRANRLGSAWRRAGLHLRIHPASKVFAYFDEPIYGSRGVPQGLGFKHPDLSRVTFEGVFTPRPAAAPLLQAAGRELKWWMDRYDHLAAFGFMLFERSRGRFFNAGPWPVLRYRLKREDVFDLTRAALFCGEVFFAAGAKRVSLPFAGRQAQFESIDALRAIDPASVKSTEMAACGFHPQGTASLGVVVDQNLKLKGTKNIFVCDASVLPVSPRVNPQVTIMGLSLWLGKFLGDQ